MDTGPVDPLYRSPARNNVHAAPSAASERPAATPELPSGDKPANDTQISSIPKKSRAVAIAGEPNATLAPAHAVSLRTEPALPELPPRDVINWNGKVTARGVTVYRPTSEQQIIAIMKKERAVRVGGGLHSFNAAMVPARGGAFIDMRAFNRVADPVRHADGSITVRVQPGATVKQVSTALAQHGLALENLPTSEEITIGGATANGAHGSGLTSPAVLAEQIAGMTVVTSAGKRKVIANEDLPLYRINMGLLGVVTEIELRCVPDFDLLQADDKLVGDEAVLAALEPSRLRAEVSQLQSTMWFFNQDLNDSSKTQLVRRRLKKLTRQESADLESTGVPRKSDYDAPSAAAQERINQGYRAAAAATGQQASELKAQLRNKIQPDAPRLGRSALMYQRWFNIPFHDVSYALPLEKAQEAYTRVSNKMRELGYETTIPMAMRVLRASDATLMGLNSGRDVVSFELFSHLAFDDANGEKRADVKEADEAFEQIMIEMGGRPHWGKECTKKAEASFEPSVWQRFASEHEKVGAKLTNAWAEQFAPTLGLRTAR